MARKKSKTTELTQSTSNVGIWLPIEAGKTITTSTNGVIYTTSNPVGASIDKIIETKLKPYKDKVTLPNGGYYKLLTINDSIYIGNSQHDTINSKLGKLESGGGGEGGIKNPVESNIDMASFSILNLKDAANPKDAVNLSVLESKESSLQSYIDSEITTVNGNIDNEVATLMDFINNNITRNFSITGGYEQELLPIPEKTGTEIITPSLKIESFQNGKELLPEINFETGLIKLKPLKKYGNLIVDFCIKGVFKGEIIPVDKQLSIALVSTKYDIKESIEAPVNQLEIFSRHDIPRNSNDSGVHVCTGSFNYVVKNQESRLVSEGFRLIMFNHNGTFEWQGKQEVIVNCNYYNNVPA